VKIYKLKNKSFKLVVNIDPSLVPKEVPLICLTLPDLDDPDADSAWMNQADKRIFFYKSNHGNDSYDAISQKDDPRSWENHPDGTGIIRNWRLIDREVLLLVIDLQPADAKRIPQLSESPSEISFYLKNWPYQDSLIESVRQIDQTYSNSVSKLNQKQQLGELDDAGKTKQLRSLRIRKRDSYMALLERF
jgi:hypothetical protein